MRPDYVVTDGQSPHVQRARELIKRHPDVRDLFGPYPLSAVCIAAVVAFQIGIAYWLRDAHWLLVAAAAYLIGAFASHALFVLIHDASHNLILARHACEPRSSASSATSGRASRARCRFAPTTCCTTGTSTSTTTTPTWRFAGRRALVGNSPVRKALWLLVFAAVEVMRPLRIRGQFADPWLVGNVIVIAATDYVIWRFCGVAGLAYVLLSTFIGIGLHPLGARWIQEHYTFVAGQETYSYYGILNRLSFNIGYHNEHHDLGACPVDPPPEGEGARAGVLRSPLRAPLADARAACSGSSIRSSTSSRASRATAIARWGRTPTPRSSFPQPSRSRLLKKGHLLRCSLSRLCGVAPLRLRVRSVAPRI